MKQLYFGENLKYLRETSGLKSAQFYEKLDVKRTTWSGYENNKSFPKVEDLIRIAEYFGVDEKMLLHVDLKNAKSKSGVNSSLSNAVYQNKKDNELTVQEEAHTYKKSLEPEIIWRDKYIAVLEKKLSETVASLTSHTFETLSIKLLALQAFMLEHVTNTSGVSLQNMIADINEKEKELRDGVRSNTMNDG